MVDVPTTRRTVITVSLYPNHAKLVLDGLMAAHPDHQFRCVTDSASARIEVVVGVQGLRVTPDRVVAAMERYAAGYYAALKAHCSL